MIATLHDLVPSPLTTLRLRDLHTPLSSQMVSLSCSLAEGNLPIQPYPQPTGAICTFPGKAGPQDKHGGPEPTLHVSLKPSPIPRNDLPCARVPRLFSLPRS